MNRSFRSQQVGSLRTSMMKEKDDELTLFLEMRRREKERQNLLNNSDEFDASLGSKMGTSPVFNIESGTSVRKTATDDFLNSDNDKNDYDWLLTPPGTPLFPSLEMESHKSVMNQQGSPKTRPIALKSRLGNMQEGPGARNSSIAAAYRAGAGMNSSSGGGGVRRPSSSSSSTGGGGSLSSTRPATPTGRHTIPRTTTTTSSTTSTSTSTSKSGTTTRPSLTSSRSAPPPPSKPSKPSRSSTPTPSTNRTTTTTTNKHQPVSVPSRSSTPTARSSSTTRTRSLSSSTSSSIPPSKPVSKPTSRTSTPTRRLNTTTQSTSTKPSSSSSSSSVVIVPSRPSSPSVKPRPWKPSDIPGFSLDAPPNLRTTLPDRPLSATRGRPGAPSSRSSSVEPVPNGRIRRQSCSPSRGRPPNSGSSVPAMNRLYAKANDNVSPVMIGNKMVERVINMRKLAPPKRDDKHSSPQSNSSPDSLGIGRTLSKKSLDMAIRHMDIRRRIPGNLRPLMTNIPASAMYSVRPGGGERGERGGGSKSRHIISVSDSPLATSSNASSEFSVNNNSFLDDDAASNDSVRGR